MMGKVEGRLPRPADDLEPLSIDGDEELDEKKMLTGGCTRMLCRAPVSRIVKQCMRCKYETQSSFPN
jgi:hypothetical protein